MGQLEDKHLLIDIRNTSNVDLDDTEKVTSFFRKIVEKIGLNTVKVDNYDFEPHGTTIVLFLAESHLVYSSWPEFNGATVDIFPWKGYNSEIFDDIENFFNTKDVTYKVLNRRYNDSQKL